MSNRSLAVTLSVCSGLAASALAQPTAHILATGDSGIALNGLASAWSVPANQPGAGSSTLGGAMTSLSNNVGLAVRAIGTSGDLQWSNVTSGQWAPFVAVGTGINTRARPALASDSEAGHLFFLGQDFKHYYVRYRNVSNWQAVEPVGGTVALQSFGPTAPAAAAIGENAYVVYHDGGDSNFISMRIRQWAGEGNPAVWSPTLRVSNVPPAFLTPPAVAAAVQPLPASGGPVAPWDLMVAFVRGGDTAIVASRRLITSGAPAFEAAQPVPGAFSIERPALVGLSGGRALLVFRGTDNNLYSTQWGATTNAWSTVSPVFNTEQAISAPALARGWDPLGQEAQLAWLTPTGFTAYARFTGGATGVWQDRQVSLGGVAGGSGYSTVSIARLARIADLELAPVSATTLTPGQTTVVQLTVRNRGPEAGPNSDIAISMPADGSLRFESLSVPVSSPGNVPLWTVSQVPAVGGFGSIQLLSNASIAPGAEQVINLTVRANPLQATSTVATLSFGNTGALPDPVLTNNQNVLRPIAINVPAACYANCDASTISPVLNAGDFTCFLSRFRAAQSLPAAQQASDYSNCDESTTPPVLNAGDFTCFLSRFRAGCP